MSNVLAVTAASMSLDIDRLAAIAHNLANATTTGFKRGIPVTTGFPDVLAHAGQGIVGAPTLPTLHVATDFTPGAQRHTGAPLDLAIDGNGFFELKGAGDSVFTRQGNFRIDASGKLVSENGMAVVGTGGDIVVSGGRVSVDNQGRVFDDARQVGQIRVARFGNPQDLESVGAGLYIASASATPRTDGVQKLRPGFLEASNVSTMHEMVRLIETMRHFESTQKAMIAYDGMLDRSISRLGEF